jgi:hypothetical protein
MKQVQAAIGEALRASGLELPDEATLEQFSVSFVQNYAPFLVGWTQPSQITLVADGQSGASGAFWSERDCDDVRRFLETPDMPDDVPVFGSPVILPTIRPLTFTRHVHDGDEETYIAQSIVGTFAVWERRQGGFVLKAPPDYRNEVIGEDIEEAFTAANVEFSAIIRTVLL